MSIPSRLGLCTDLYEVRMAQTYLRHGMVEPATFSLFARPSSSRPFLVAAGLQRALEILDHFQYGPGELAYLREQGVSSSTLEWLERLSPTGEVWAIPEGTVVLGDEPLLEITAPLPVAQLLETSLMNALHVDTLVATKAALCTRAARGRPVVDFGFRRAHGLESGIRAARAAYVGGAAKTSNVEAGRQFKIPVSGTMAHSFVQAFDDELRAFREFAADHTQSPTLLVETYDPHQGIENAIRVAHELARTGCRLGAIRIDSEPLGNLARDARRMLDEADLHRVKIFLSGGLDEKRIDELMRDEVPVDGFGVGSALVVSDDKPALDVAYKLVEYAGVGRAKYAEAKETYPGQKQVFRRGAPTRDVLDRRDAPQPAGATPLLQLAWRDGETLQDQSLQRARELAATQLSLIPDEWFFDHTDPPPPPIPEIGESLRRHRDEVSERIVRINQLE